MSIHLSKLLQAKHILLLQGPMGPFFSNFADWLEQKNISCYKVNFNAGDWRYYHARPRILHFRQRPALFPLWLSQHLKRYAIDTIVCFGDCRDYHIQAKKLALQMGIAFYVFEEGYVRPDYITFEANGVNDFSDFQANLDLNNIALPDAYTQKANNCYVAMAFASVQYYLCWVLLCWLYPYYRHHRSYHPLQELGFWLISGMRRIKNFLTEPIQLKQLIEQHSQCYFVFALQVHNDFQVKIHSDYIDMYTVIDEVIQSFAQSAQPMHYLVFKHHPMDRGYRDYSHFIHTRASAYGVSERIYYLCDVHLPSLLKHSLGLVTINSTTGIQALYHQIPVKVLGRAIYDFPHLTSQVSLDEFWTMHQPVDAHFFHTFRNLLIYYTQLNGAYYGRHFWMKK